MRGLIRLDDLFFPPQFGIDEGGQLAALQHVSSGFSLH
jgi:hypothetical protein